MENKQLLIETALNLFYQKGYDAVGIQEVVDKAGLTKPTLYHYFGSKQGLLETLLNTKFEEMKAVLYPAAEYQGDLPFTLYRTAAAFIDYAIANKKVYMLMMALFYSAKENDAYRAVQPIIHEVYGLMVSIFDRAEKQLGNMRGRQKQFAIGFMGIINHYILLVCDKGTENVVVGEEMKRELVNQFMYGIYS